MCLRVCFLLFACIYFNISVFVYLTVSVSVFLCISFSVYTRLCVCRCHCNCMYVSCMAHSYCYPCPRLCSCPLPGCWRYGGWHTCLSRDPGSIPAQCSYQIKIGRMCEECQFDSTKHRRFSPGILRFPPVQTLESFQTLHP